MKTNIMIAIAAIVASQAAAGATNDVVTAGQLNKVEQIAKSAQTNSNNNAAAMGQVNVKVKGLEGDIKAIGNTSSSAALKAAGADAKAVTATKIGNEAKRDASKAQATGVAAQGTANIAKLHADKLEAQKVDVTVFEEDQRRQDAIATANTTAIGNETLARESDVAGLENRKADKSQVAEVARAADATSRSYAEQAEKSANAYTDSRFDAAGQRMNSLERQQQQTQREVRSGVADVAAMANIPTAREIGHMNLGVGTGFYKDTGAVAVGGSYRLSEAVTFKGSLSTTGRDTVAGAGMSFEF